MFNFKTFLTITLTSLSVVGVAAGIGYASYNNMNTVSQFFNTNESSLGVLNPNDEGMIKRTIEDYFPLLSKDTIENKLIFKHTKDKIIVTSAYYKGSKSFNYELEKDITKDTTITFNGSSYGVISPIGSNGEFSPEDSYGQAYLSSSSFCSSFFNQLNGYNTLDFSNCVFKPANDIKDSLFTQFPFLTGVIDDPSSFQSSIANQFDPFFQSIKKINFYNTKFLLTHTDSSDNTFASANKLFFGCDFRNVTNIDFTNCNFAYFDSSVFPNTCSEIHPA